MSHDASTLEHTIRRMADNEEIRDVLIRYAMAIDARDWRLLHEVFTADGIANYGELAGVHEGPDAVGQACHQALSGLDSSQHLITNITIRHDGDDSASTVCYFHAQHYLVDSRGGNTYVIAGTYRDRLTRTDTGWRIAYRTLETTWTDGDSGVFELAQSRLAEREADD